MKKISGLFLALALLVIPVKAQNEQVSVPKSMLTQEQIDKVNAAEIQDKIQKYGNWVGIGHELGTAVNESLSAITTQANNFAQTPVGKLTAALVVWKVVGHDGMGFIIGALEIILIFPLWVWSYRKYLPRNIVDTETLNDKGKVVSRTYKLINNPLGANNYSDNTTAFVIGHYVMLGILFVVAMVTMWS